MANPNSFKEKVISNQDFSKVIKFYNDINSGCRHNTGCRQDANRIRAYYSSLLRAIIARSHLLFFKIFSNFVYFWPNFHIFCPFLPFFNIFLLFFWKIARMPLLSRIGPDKRIWWNKWLEIGWLFYLFSTYLYFFGTNDAASKSIILSYINIFVWKIEKLLMFCFLLLSNNTLHVMFYTYICYWNTFQYKYII